MTYLRQFLSWLIDDPQEELDEQPEMDIQYKTYIYHGNVEEWEGTTKWVVRNDA